MRRNVLLIATIAGSVALGYWISRPKPIGVGDLFSTLTEKQGGKQGGDIVTFVVTHDKVWGKRSGGNGHRYLALLRVQEVSQWGLAEAAVVAKRMGGHLVAVETAEENAWLFNEIAQDPQLWSPFVRKAPDEFHTDMAIRQRELSDEYEDYYNKYKNKIKGADEPGFIPIAATNGPLIGVWVSEDGRSLVWDNGRPVEYGSWAPFEPYFQDGTFRIAFGYANMQGGVPVSTWVRRSCNNNILEDIPNVTISFIVEIPG